MAELIVVGFKKDMHRASEVLNTLREMQSSLVVDLQDAVAVYRDTRGTLRVDQSAHATTLQGGARGALLGGLIGALLGVPFTGGVSVAALLSITGVAIGASSGALHADTWKDQYGISEDLVQRVSGMVQPGDSAIFAMLRSLDPEIVTAQFKGYGGTILRTTLNPEQRAKVDAMLHAR
jgi:uncharacterized membrane protein